VTDLILDPDGTPRCWWCGADDSLYRAYHDDEWGREKRGDDALFELLSLEGFQAGLSWLTILRKRERFRHAFAGFSIERVADFDERDVERLLGDAGIIRHRGKIEATIGNAGAALELAEGLSDFVWSYAPPRRSVRPSGRGELPAATAESTALSKELKRRGFRFVGPTTVYAFMQSAGFVDDHLAGCHVAEELG
jgi:DNA-3-methyladenine glycosylase I